MEEALDGVDIDIKLCLLTEQRHTRKKPNRKHDSDRRQDERQFQVLFLQCGFFHDATVLS
jgi:hypothetical protein